MQFGNPTALWTLAGLPLLVLAGWMALRRHRRVIERIGRPELIARLYPASVLDWRRRRFGLVLAVFVLLCVAAARPQYGQIEQTLQSMGLDILIAIDTSDSMLAADIKPNRLAKAKDSLRRFVARLRGNRIGIIAFAGDAFLLCPITLDHSNAALVLEAIDVDSIGVPGTDLGRAIDVAREAFENGGAGSSVLVLITDGEDNEEHGLAAARVADEKGIRIYTIGIGTEQGAPVPDGQGGYKERIQGGKVISRLDMTSLERISAATGGSAYAAGENIGAAVNLIAREIDGLEKKEQEARKLIIHQDRYGWFLAPAIALLVWLLISRPRHQRQVHGMAFEEAA
jgi:Ca-activated chloride channel family protein